MTAAAVRLLGAADVRRLAAELDLRPTKQRGQNFVIDANTVRRIVRESGVDPDDIVVEVGPGLGSLTLALLEVAAPRRRDRGRRARSRPGCPPRSPSTPATAPTAARSSTPTPSASTASRARRRPLWSRTCPTTSRCPCSSTCSPCCPRSRRGWSWSRPRWPTGSRRPPARAPTASRRSRPRGSPTYAARGRSAATSSGRRPTSTPAWSPGPAASRPRRPRRGSRSSRSWTPPSPSVARPCAAPSPGSPARRRPPRRALRAAGVDPTARGEVLDVTAFARIAEALSQDAAGVTGQRHRPRAGQDQPPPRRRRAAGGRLPPAGDRLPGRRAVRRRHRRALARLDARRHRPRLDRRRRRTRHRRQHRRPRRAAAGRAPRHRLAGRRSPSPRRSRSPAAWPVARPTRPPRWSHSTGSGSSTPPTTTCSRSRPGWGVTCRSRSLGGTALGTGRGEQVEPVPDPATWWWVAVPVDARAVHAGGLPALRRARSRRPGRTARSPRRTPRALDRRPGDPGGRAPQRPRDGRPRPASRPRPTCWSWASAAARCAAWCPARDPPACS